tara:strand:- start:100 stop:900 length:801 start_codon:yes stop_codon:yes gene_type:complete
MNIEKFIQKKDLASYGNKSLSENLKSVDTAIAKLQYTERIWDKSRSQFQLKYITCGQADAWMRMRQISAEVARKRQALTEAKFNYMERVKRAEIKERNAEEEEDSLKAELLQIGAARLKSQGGEILVKMEGAMKEIQTLSGMYDTLKEIIGDVSESEFELVQFKAHIKRALMQSIREVRMQRVIGTGNQEYLEQCGVSPTATLKEIVNFLEQENEKAVGNTSMMHSFLDDFAERYAPACVQQAEWLGFESKADMSLTYSPNGEEKQ